MICFACKYSQFLSLLPALSCFSLYNIDVNIHLKCPCYLSLFISLVICNSFIYSLSLSLPLSFSDPFSLFKGERASPAPLCFTLANCMYVRIVDWCTCPLARQFVVSVVDRWIMRVGACGESVYVRANWTKTPAVKTTRCTILYCPCSIFWLA